MRRPLIALTLSVCALLSFAATSFAAIIALDAPATTATSVASTIVEVGVTAGPTGAPNGFTVEWMLASVFDQLGDWPVDPANPNLHSATFLGTPTLNTVDGTRTFLLAPLGTATVQLGDLFDETGFLAATTVEEMLSGTEYVFRVRADGDASLSPGGTGLYGSSPYSPTDRCTTKPHSDLEDCVHSQGYWKEHGSRWPVSSLKLGTIIYTKTQLLAIMNQPARGNGLVSLSHQLIAAKLNVLSGAVPGATITNAIATADAMIGSRIIPSIGAGYIAPSVTSNLNDVLESFNSDERAHNCLTPTAVKSSSWGALKAMYR